MTDTTEPTEITLSIDDEVLFRLRERRRPLVYADMVARVSYDMGVNVLHIGTIWGVAYFEDAEALELDDSTVVAVADIDPDSVLVNPAEALGAPSSPTPPRLYGDFVEHTGGGPSGR